MELEQPTLSLDSLTDIHTARLAASFYFNNELIKEYFNGSPAVVPSERLQAIDRVYSKLWYLAMMTEVALTPDGIEPPNGTEPLTSTVITDPHDALVVAEALRLTAEMHPDEMLSMCAAGILTSYDKQLVRQ